MNIFFIILPSVIIVFVLFLFYKRRSKAKSKYATYEDRLGTRIAAFAFIRSYEFVKEKIVNESDISPILTEQIQYKSALMYTCMMIELFQKLPDSVDLDTVATKALSQVIKDNTLYINLNYGKNDNAEISAHIITDYQNMLDKVAYALQTKSPHILSSIYRDYVICNDELYHKFNTDFFITTMVISWIGDVNEILGNN